MNFRSLLSLLLPYRRTTIAEAREALVSCGIDPEAIRWEVKADGSFGFGAKGGDDGALTYEKISHLLAWARRRRIKVWFMSREELKG